MNLCCVCCWAVKRRSRTSRVSIVRRRRTGGGGEREKEEKYWPWRHILKQLNRNYSHLLFRSFWSFFSPLIPVCVAAKKSETRTQLRQQVDSSAVDSFPCVFFSRFFFGRARRAEAEAEPVSRDERAMKERKVKLKLISTSIALSTQEQHYLESLEFDVCCCFVLHTIFRDKSSCPGRYEIVLNFIVVVVDVSLGHRKK